MARPNLLRIDDALLRAAGIAGLLWFLGAVIALGFVLNDALPVSTAIGSAILAASAPIGLFLAGSRVRRRERRAWALHRLVADHVELSASDLLRDSDFTDATLDRAIRDLNNAGAAYLVWDRKSDLIQDGRLRNTRVDIEDCPSCGAKVSVTLRVGDVAGARCPYCHDPFGAERHNQEKARLIDELDTDPAITSARNRSDSSFSIPIFAILTLFFWPLGIGYALWKWQAGELPL